MKEVLESQGKDDEEEVNKLKKNLNEVGEKAVSDGGPMVIDGNVEDLLPKDVPEPEVPTTLPTLTLTSSSTATGSSLTTAAMKEAAEKLKVHVSEGSQTPEIPSTSKEGELVEMLQDLEILSLLKFDNLRVTNTS